jgi:hypothetical protein
MQKPRIPGGVAVFVFAVALSTHVAPARAAEDDQGGRVEVTFTKWLLNGPGGTNPGFMRGVTGGEIGGVFIGETFVNVPKANPDLPALSNLEVIYGVQADDPDRSFTALIRGGAALGKAQLDGRILAGWRIGAPVHVEWVRFPSPSVDCPSPPAFAGPFCFVGTMTIERAGH